MASQAFGQSASAGGIFAYQIGWATDGLEAAGKLVSAAAKLGAAFEAELVESDPAATRAARGCEHGHFLTRAPIGRGAFVAERQPRGLAIPVVFPVQVRRVTRVSPWAAAGIFLTADRWPLITAGVTRREERAAGRCGKSGVMATLRDAVRPAAARPAALAVNK